MVTTIMVLCNEICLLYQSLLANCFSEGDFHIIPRFPDQDIPIL